jgi:putative phage-type endonuclease
MIEIRQIKSREEWLDWRREVLTASDIGAVAGVDPFKTPLRVYAEKTTGNDFEENALMRRGRLFEAAAVEYLREAHPTWQIERPNEFYIDVDLKLGCTPDAFAHDGDSRINCQIKTVSAPVFEKWDGLPPKSYLLQTACENMLTRADDGLLAVLIVSTYSAELIEFAVPRHPAAENRICDIARDFWANVKRGLVPKPDYEQDAEIIAALYPPSKEVPTPLDLSGDNRIYAALEEREQLKGDIKAAEATVKALDAEIVHKLNGAELATVDGWKITNKITHRGEYTVAAKDYPVLRVAKTGSEATP